MQTTSEAQVLLSQAQTQPAGRVVTCSSMKQRGLRPMDSGWGGVSAIPLGFASLDWVDSHTGLSTGQGELIEHFQRVSGAWADCLQGRSSGAPRASHRQAPTAMRHRAGGSVLVVGAQELTVSGPCMTRRPYCLRNMTTPVL